MHNYVFLTHFPQQICNLSKTNTFFSHFEGRRGKNLNTLHQSNSPTYHAILGGDIETFKLCYGFEKEINPFHSGGYAKRTLLHLAVREEKIDIVKIILEKLPTGQKNPENRYKETPLSIATHLGPEYVENIFSCSLKKKTSQKRKLKQTKCLFFNF